jgi:hypothetical protein
MSTNEELFDLRTVERNLSRGLVSKKAHKAFLDGLEDCADLGEEAETVFAHTIKDEEDEADA